MNKTVFAARNIFDKLKKVVGSWSTFQFYWKTYILSKIEKTNPDVYLVSYPKCGRTWLRIMLNKFAEINGHKPKKYNDNAIVEIAENFVIKFEHDKGNWVPSPPKLKNITFNKEKYKNKKIIFLIRDPRDVLVSSWYHLKFRENIYRKELSDFIREELTGVEKVCKFFNTWYENRNSVKDFILLTYEGLHQNTHEVLSQMLEFIGFEPTGETIKQAVDAASFDKMKKMETKGNLKEPWMKPGYKKINNSLKIRKGKKGGYKEEFNQEDIQYLNKKIKQHLHPDLIKMIDNLS